VYIDAVPQLVRVRRKASHAEERAAFRSTPPTPLPQRRKINCSFAIAPAQKFAWWAAMCYAGVVSKARSTPPTPHQPLRKINCILQNALAEKGA